MVDTWGKDYNCGSHIVRNLDDQKTLKNVHPLLQRAHPMIIHSCRLITSAAISETGGIQKAELAAAAACS